MNTLNHLAIIMDGNGRWAKNRTLIRTDGHKKGADTVENIAIYCAKNGIKNLTLYAFSTENWKRPKSEVDFLLNLLLKFIKLKENLFLENSIRFHTIGDLSPFSTQLKNAIANLKDKTKDNSRLNLILAINYGSQNEIVRAVNSALANGVKIDEKSISSHLDSADFGDVDLMIRTGGEHRLSNFLLWQSSYAELAFTPTLWPDFDTKELDEIIAKFKITHRKFGAI
ncbi:MAG: polyprenyl diphosphate synthase [Campylobacter lanienae]|uniref:Isoprenyl transferase n=1 Tax=Campylobacter lanienae NCTC 13004 TaxID=1031753 RepID=A0A1X9SN94_9BACT|nr:polyprenyl diphosphate synthase [Campylobacter lanienae]ARQ97668.1 undecaprenyl diphosphate synthetase [Campylobacter lanienae NCTC 13004]MCI7364549.1 polyprenyl diphosphate synthase [Campylobacter lanienae]